MDSLFPELDLEKLKASYSTGILPAQTIRDLLDAGYVGADTPILDEQIQPASIDLRLGSVAYRVRSSFLPGDNFTVERKLEQVGYHEIDLTKPAVLEVGSLYVIPLQEHFVLPSLISGKGNPKSTIGRLDVFTRLLTDYGVKFDRVADEYRGKLYLEVMPRTFGVVVRRGTRMYQVRLIRGNPRPAEKALRELDKEGLVFTADQPGEANIENTGLQISLDLEGDNESDIVGYRARRNTWSIDLEKQNYFEPSDYWEVITRPRTRGIIIDPADFYLLLSKEKIRVPPEFAAELVPYDPQMGEFRVHYAGFFDPGFGYGAGDISGTHAVLEVRAHGVPFLLENGQSVGRLVYERLLSRPDRIYGPDIGSSYQRQRLSLSKQFKRSSG